MSAALKAGCREPSSTVITVPNSGIEGILSSLAHSAVSHSREYPAIPATTKQRVDRHRQLAPARLRLRLDANHLLRSNRGAVG